MSNEDLLALIEEQRSIMIEVSTGGYDKMAASEEEYKKRRVLIRDELQRRKIQDPSTFVSLRGWYDRWSSGDLPQYKNRRAFINAMYDTLTEQISRQLQIGSRLFDEPIGWDRVDRVLEKLRQNLELATSEEDYQSLGLLCRELLISVAQAVYQAERHNSGNESFSPTDSKRMLEYFNIELSGGPNEEARRHAKAALDLANALQHRRTATFRAAALCAEAAASVVNVVAILSGRRIPSHA
jgi:hypothetical protein